MKATFYDVKTRVKVQADVTEKIKYPNDRYAFRAKTADGRNLTKFVKKADYEAVQV